MRVLEPSKLEKYRLAKKLGIDDGEDLIGCTGFALAGLAVPVAGLAAGFSLWFLSLFALTFVPAMLVLPYFLNSQFHYSHNSTLYTQAITKYRGLWQEGVKSEANQLLQSIWAHEQALFTINKSHTDKSDCKDCRDRVDLIERLAETQSLPTLDRSDIEAIEARLSVRKELGI